MNGMTNEIGQRAVRALGAVLLASCLALVSPAQLPGQVGVAAGACPDDEVRGTIGISSFECKNCRLTTDGNVRVWNFSSEPIVRVVEPGSPAAGKLREGDEIVAVDGHLITTGEGGRRLGNLVPGRAVSLVVRSGSRERTVEIVPDGECPRPGAHAAPPAVAAAPPTPGAEPAKGVGVTAAVPRAAVAPPARAAAPAGVAVAAGPVPRPTYSLLSSGWFGLGIECTNCRWSVDKESGQSEWEFSAPPEVSSVEERSPAADAGLRRGDVLLEIDGMSLTSREGGQRFGSVEPGETVRLTYNRGAETRSATVTAARRPGMAPPPPGPGVAPSAYASRATSGYASAAASRLRYSGLVGETSVEVRGAGSVVVNIIEPGREIEIVTSDSRTRIRLDDSK